MHSSQQWVAVVLVAAVALLLLLPLRLLALLPVVDLAPVVILVAAGAPYAQTLSLLPTLGCSCGHS